MMRAERGMERSVERRNTNSKACNWAQASFGPIDRRNGGGGEVLSALVLNQEDAGRTIHFCKMDTGPHTHTHTHQE